MKLATSTEAKRAWQLTQELQESLSKTLCQADVNGTTSFEKVSWLRDEGQHGGGWRLVASSEGVFNRASINISQVHYDDLPEKKLASATALSTIVHPKNPLAPSTHMHISWTEQKSGEGYWRIMADLNPSNPIGSDKTEFQQGFKELAPEQLKEGTTQGDQYFFIPELKRHRGVSHFYLEQYATNDQQKDFQLARSFGLGMIRIYRNILKKALTERTNFSEQDQTRQLHYHTVYLFQVLTLDRGTTSGLLVHNQNDLGIMGSLPSKVDKSLLQSWQEFMAPARKKLLQGIVDSIPESGAVDDATKLKLAASVRQFYKNNPEALSFQAKGFTIPPTVNNHI